MHPSAIKDSQKIAFGQVAWAEFNFEALNGSGNLVLLNSNHLPKFPGVERDIAFLGR